MTIIFDILISVLAGLILFKVAAWLGRKNGEYHHH